MSEPNSALDKVEAGIEKVLAGQQGLTKDVDGLKKASEDVTARLGEVESKQASTEDWLKEVEAKQAKARFGHNGVDELRNVIPDRHRCLAAQFALRGERRIDGTFAPVNDERAIKLAAMESWLKMSAQLQMGMVENPGEIREQMRKLERAFAYTRATYTEGTTTTGGNTVPDPLAAEVLRIILDAGIVRMLSRNVAMTADTLRIPAKGGNVTAYIIGEAATITKGEGTFGQETLTAKKFGAYGESSSELIQDSQVGIVDFFFSDAGEQIALKEDSEALEGDGTNFTGVNSASGVNSVTNGTNGAEPSLAKLTEQKWAGKYRQSRRNAAWITSPEGAARIEQMQDTNGNPIWKNDLVNGQTRFAGADLALMGFPLYTTDQVPSNITTGSEANTTKLYFGNWREGVIFGDRMGMEFMVSPHPKMQEDLIAMRLLKRTAILVALAGLLTKQTGIHTE